MKAILHTNVVIWTMENDPRLGEGAKQLVCETEGSELAISDISLLEISMLVSKNRISLNVELAAYLRSISNLVAVLPINSHIAASAMSLTLPHGDPFDRIITATAKYYQVPLLTRDRLITQSKVVSVIWN